MRFIDLEKFIKLRRSISIRVGVFYSLPMAILLFLLTISGGFFEAILFGLLVFVLIFGLIYVIREVTHKGVERKRAKTNFECLYLDVFYRREVGALSILDDRLKYHCLTPGGVNKDFELQLNEKTFIAAGEVKYTKLQSIRYKGSKQGYIIARELPHGLVYKFTFYDMDDVLNKVIHRIDEVSKFEGEKDDGETTK